MPRPRRKAPPATIFHSGCLALICLDTDLLRAKEEKLHEKSSQKFHEETLRLQTFEEVEKPAFRNWMETEFPELILACREHDQEIEKLHDFIEDVEDYAYHYRISKREACRQVREKQALGEPLFDEEDEDNDDIDGSQGPGAHSEGFGGDDPFDDLASFFEAAFGFKVPGREEKAKDPRPSASANRSTVDSVKKIYRSLAQLLHPDRATDERPHDPELWHKVQSAYAQGDLYGLEKIWQSLSAGGTAHSTSRHTSLWDLRQLRRQMEGRLRQIRRQIKLAKEDPAWDFSTVLLVPRKLAAIRRKLKEDLTDDLQDLLHDRRVLEGVVTKWEKPVPKKAARKVAAKKAPKRPLKTARREEPSIFF